MVERLVDVEKVEGSIPSARTIIKLQKGWDNLQILLPKKEVLFVPAVSEKSELSMTHFSQQCYGFFVNRSCVAPNFVNLFFF